MDESIISLADKLYHEIDFISTILLLLYVLSFLPVKYSFSVHSELWLNGERKTFSCMQASWNWYNNVIIDFNRIFMKKIEKEISVVNEYIDLSIINSINAFVHSLYKEYTWNIDWLIQIGMVHSSFQYKWGMHHKI